MALQRYGQRPRSYRNRTHAQSVYLDPRELAVLKSEADLAGLALGAYIRGQAVTAALRDRERRRTFDAR